VAPTTQVSLVLAHALTSPVSRVPSTRVESTVPQPIVPSSLPPSPRRSPTSTPAVLPSTLVAITSQLVQEFQVFQHRLHAFLCLQGVHTVFHCRLGPPTRSGGPMGSIHSLHCHPSVLLAGNSLYAFGQLFPPRQTYGPRPYRTPGQLTQFLRCSRSPFLEPSSH